MQKFYEITATTYLTKNIPFQHAQEIISSHINRTMLDDDDLKEKHISRGFKYYTFSSFYPLEKDKVYKANKIYIFRLRSIDKTFVQKMCKLLKKVDTGYFNILSIEMIEKRETFISKLYTVTPTVLTIDRNTHWQIGEDFNKLKLQLHGNAERKYNEYFRSSIRSDSFFEGIEIVNPKTIVMSYKEGYLMGNKFKLHIKSDPVSQTLAQVILACGLGEKNSLGMGYCHAD